MRGRLRRSAGQTEKLSRGYFPRAVFFFGLGFLVLPVLAGAAAFFGRFGDTCSLLPWLGPTYGCCKRARPAKVARRCVPVSLSRATAAPRLSEQTTRQEKGSASTDQATRS